MADNNDMVDVSVSPSRPNMNGNSESFQDNQSAADKAKQADKDMPSALSHGGDGVGPGPSRE